MTPEEFDATALNLQHLAEAAAVVDLTDPDAPPWREYLTAWTDAGFMTLLTVRYLFYVRGFEELLNLNGRTATKSGGLSTKLGFKTRLVSELEPWAANLQAKAAKVAKDGHVNSRAGREYVHLARQARLVSLLVQDYFWHKKSFEELLAQTKEYLNAEQEILTEVNALVESLKKL
jgi:hypothetical protein